MSNSVLFERPASEEEPKPEKLAPVDRASIVEAIIASGVEPWRVEVEGQNKLKFWFDPKFSRPIEERILSGGTFLLDFNRIILARERWTNYLAIARSRATSVATAA